MRRIRRDTQRPKLILWLGSSIGNLDRPSAERFVSNLRGGMNLEDRLLLGIDLRKDRDVLESAYDDSSGVTARFNQNLLARINRELGGQFDPETFFQATYDEVGGKVVSHLQPTGPDGSDRGSRPRGVRGGRNDPDRDRTGLVAASESAGFAS